jgi:tRNA/tmRNA/rRNA uracil-C5-methylase (TrmA/RlmC/RlmD family)
MNPATIRDLLSFLTRLKTAHVHYALADPTDGAVMVEVAVPGERWEIEFMKTAESVSRCSLVQVASKGAND